MTAPTPACSPAPEAEAAEDAALPDLPEKGPLRRCVATREVRTKEEMLRFVVSPSRELVPDPAGRLPGRGLWLTAEADALERALKAGSFAKAAKAPVVVPPDIRGRVADGLRARIRDLIGFARRGGQAVSGRDAVLDWLRAGRAAVLVEASDGSEAERNRLTGGRGYEVLTPLTADELGKAFGRERAAHAAVAEGNLARLLRRESARLAGFLRQPG
jgi:predicted RNA-binding protein YlxR (DUF448 family)